jgi:hypothetical protein
MRTLIIYISAISFLLLVGCLGLIVGKFVNWITGKSKKGLCVHEQAGLIEYEYDENSYS